MSTLSKAATEKALTCAGVILFNRCLTHTVLVESAHARGFLSFPKGKLDYDERLHRDFVGGALRELYEETGLHPEHVQLAAMSLLEPLSDDATLYLVGTVNDAFLQCLNMLPLDEHKQEIRSARWYSLEPEVQALGPERLRADRKALLPAALALARTVLEGEPFEAMIACVKASAADAKLSDALSCALRYRGMETGLRADAEGYIPLADLLLHAHFRALNAQAADVVRVVEQSEEKLFEIAERGGVPCIRAAQSRSTEQERCATE